LAVVLLSTGAAWGAAWGMKAGTPELKSAGSLVFGPDGVLFVGDAKSATIFAVDTGEAEGAPDEVGLQVPDVDGKIAALLKQPVESVIINDLAVNPLSGTAYVSVAYGAEKQPAIIRVLPNSELSVLELKDVKFSQVVLPNPPADQVTGEGRRQRNNRDQSITDLAFSDGRLLVSGISGDGASNVREIMFPFAEADQGANIEIYHGAHGRYEDQAAVRAFVPFVIDGEPHLLAGFTCTPLVKFPIKQLESGGKVQGTTVAELGNRNQPLDMIVYQQGDKEFVLMSNSARGVMKISTDDIERPEGITTPIPGGGTAGQTYETIESWQGVVQLDRLNTAHAVLVLRNENGSYDLITAELP
jgi:hypothetical protein